MGHDLKAVQQVNSGVNSTPKNSNVKKDYYKAGEHFIPMTNGGKIVVYTNAQTKKRNAVVYDAEGHILRAGVATGAKPKPIVKATTPPEQKINVFHVKPNSDYAETNKAFYSKAGKAPNLKTEKTKDGKGFAVSYDIASDANFGNVDCYSKDGKLTRQVIYAKSGSNYIIEHKLGAAKYNYESYHNTDDGEMKIDEKYIAKEQKTYYYKENGKCWGDKDAKANTFTDYENSKKTTYDKPVIGKTTVQHLYSGNEYYYKGVGSDTGLDSIVNTYTHKRIK